MNIYLRIVLLSLAALTMTSCYTTRYDLGLKPNGNVEMDKAQPGLFGATVVDLKNHCNGGKVAAVNIAIVGAGDWFLGKKTVSMECGSGSAAGSKKKMSKKKKSKGKSRKKKPKKKG